MILYVRIHLVNHLCLLLLGAFTIIYGLFSVLIKQRWYLGEARE